MILIFSFPSNLQNFVFQRLDTNYLRLNIDSVDSPKLHMLLMAVDPDTAVTMHPNTARKVIRALEVSEKWYELVVQVAKYDF